MTTKIKLPKDAEGREVPLDTEVMYDANGKKVRITSFTYTFNVIGLWGSGKCSARISEARKTESSRQTAFT